MAQRKTPTKTKSPARRFAGAASRKSKSSTAKAKFTKTAVRRGEEQVTIDRRRAARRENDAPGCQTAASSVVPTRLERRKKVNRRRQIDPTTCERDYTDDEIQFMSALDEYKRASGRMFPTCSEVLEVVRSLGYVKLAPSELAAQSTINPCGAPGGHAHTLPVATSALAE